MEWTHDTQRNPTRATEWDRFRKGGRITWESPPRKIRRMRDMGAEQRDNATHRTTGLGTPYRMRRVRNEGGRQM
eukprot:9494312-Pyramimonas_sp.AAC.2